MRWAFVIAFLGVAGLIAGAAAQTPPSPPAIVRTVVAATKLPSLDDALLYFKAVSVSIAPGQKTSLSGPNGIIYQLSGLTEISAAEAKTMQGGQGAVIAAGTPTPVTAGNSGSTLLYFLLAPKEALDQPVVAAPAAVKELYRTAAPLPELKRAVMS